MKSYLRKLSSYLCYSHKLNSHFLISSLFVASALAVTTSALAQHPFDDLNSDEVKKVVTIIKKSGKFNDDVRFPVVKTKEPSKSEWLSGKAAKQRQAYAAIFDFKKSLMTEVIIDLNTSTILSTKDLPNIKPPVLIEEYDRARAIIRADIGWQKAVKKRGIENTDDVFVDMWAPGLMDKEEQKPGQRLLRGVSYVKGKNFYSRPLEGFVVTVDLSKGKVVKVWDEEIVPCAKGHKNLDTDSNKPLDPALKPLIIKQPEGSSITIDGQSISWHRWKFRYSMDPLKGLLLYHVQFKDEQKERSIIYKLSLADMLVPYGAPGNNWTFRNAFDVGEYGLGKTLHPLTLGQDVPENAILLESVMPDDLGNEPVVIKGAAIYERDGGILWKHRNAENGDTDLRHARQLVMTFMTTVGNYDYGINYIFNLDGSIKIDTQLTGILLARGTALEENRCSDGCVPLVEKNIIAPPHQHFFNFRIDFDIDGTSDNYAAETNVKATPKGKDNPDGNIFNLSNTIIKNEKESTREHNQATARKWKVYNQSSRNKLNHPRGYALIPEEVAFPYIDKSSQIRKRAGFIDHPIWFTAYQDDEMNGAATYPTTAPAGEGLPKYIKNNDSLLGKDVVMWYTFGVTHVPHPEEWPIMNVHHTGFTLMPMNFFSQNPAMSLAE